MVKEKLEVKMGILDTAKPFYRLEVFEPEATDPKFVISPNIFLETEKPSDDAQVTSEIYITNLNVTSKLLGHPNICELTLQHNPGNAPSIKMYSKIKVYLGYYFDDFTQGAEYSLVFTGNVRRVKVELQKTQLECRSDLYKLASLRKKIAFSAMMTIDQVIQKLAIEEGGLEMASNGIVQCEINKQPGFSISEQKSILDHIKLLSDYNGLYLYMDTEDKFHAADWVAGDLKDKASEQDQDWINARGKAEAGSTDLYKHPIEFGKDLIACDFETTTGKASSVEIIGFMPFSDDSVHTIEPPKVEFTPASGADTDLPKKIYKLSHVTREDAEKVAENLYYRINRQLTGKLKALGMPQIRLGDGVQLKGKIYEVPPFENMEFTDDDGNSQADLENKTFQVLKVNHKFNDAEGFVTRLELVEGRAAVGTVEPEAAAEAGGEVAVIEGEETEFAGIAGEVVSIGRESEDEREERFVNIIVRTMDHTNELMPNTEYILITPDDEEIEGTTGEDGTFTHEEMAVGRYQLKLKPITDPSEEEGEESEESEEE